MTNPLPFEKMPVEERQAILRALAHKLHACALIAERDGDPVWKLLLALSARLEGSSEEVAADPCRGENVVRKSLKLLSEFELRRPHGTVHEFAIMPRH